MSFWVLFTIWEFEYCPNLSFWVLSLIFFTLVKVKVFSYHKNVSIAVFFYHNFFLIILVNVTFSQTPKTNRPSDLTCKNTFFFTQPWIKKKHLPDKKWATWLKSHKKMQKYKLNHTNYPQKACNHTNTYLLTNTE